jgi:hypothetical protein
MIHAYKKSDNNSYFRWTETVFVLYLPGEVYRENCSDDAQGYQPFTTYSSK